MPKILGKGSVWAIDWHPNGECIIHSSFTPPYFRLPIFYFFINIYIYIYIFDYLIGMAFAASKKGLLWDLVSNKDSYLWSNASGIL